MKRTSIVLIGAALLAAGCGDDDDSGGSAASQAPAPAQKPAPAPAAAADGTTITLGDSEYGSMLFGSNDQAIYIFQNDSKGKTVCYDDCAEAWPPVFTDGRPRAGKGVRDSLLGTVKRRDGRLQVTYAGQPLYFYAHEGPGEVRCHNVNLNGGFWWVVGPSGKRRA
jgi:predicted lipoprotein with Yx(FWY)xxD motif